MSRWREFALLVFVAVVISVLVKAFLIQTFWIPSGSMETTLMPGDWVVANRIVYDFRDPSPGDIVVFRSSQWSAADNSNTSENPAVAALHWVEDFVGIPRPGAKVYIKRVIAVAGQTVSCCDGQGRVLVNGSALDESYISRPKAWDGSCDGNSPRCFPPITVPAGRLWVMGDDRFVSADSQAHRRADYDGTVAVSDVIGKAVWVVWPPPHWAALGQPATFGASAAGDLGGLVNSPAGLAACAVTPWLLRRRRRRGGPGRPPAAHRACDRRGRHSAAGPVADRVAAERAP